MTIKINGVPIDSKYVSGWKDIFSIEKQIGKDPDADDFKIKIFGQRATTVLNDIITASDPRSANLVISFESRGRIITGKLNANGLKFCADESCEIELNVDVDNQVKESIRNLKNINIWDTQGNGFISQGVRERRWPIYFPYCENRSLFELILSPFIVILVWPILNICLLYTSDAADE